MKRQILCMLLWLCLQAMILPASVMAQVVSECNTPLVGKGRVIDQLSGGTLCLLCGNDDLENLLDGDLNNYAEFTPLLSVLTTPIVSVKDVNADFPAGLRAGFVVEPEGGLLSAGLLSSFQIRTYLNGTLQETVSGAGLSLNLLGNTAEKQRISFVTSQSFDEIEILQTGLLTTITSVRVYYAYVEPDGCDYICRDKIIQTNYNASINDARTGLSGPFCLACFVDDEDNVVNSDTTDFGRISLFLGLGVAGAISVETGQLIPAGNEAGFVIAQNGGGLIDLSVLQNISIQTYRNDTLQENINYAGLAGITALGGNKQVVTIAASQSFDEIRIRFTSLLSVLVNINVYYAFVRPDADLDGFVDCVDRCAGEDDGFDADGDGVPDACDNGCMVNAGIDITSCQADTTAQLPAAPAGFSWSAMPGNPSPATVSNSGMVAGLDAEGSYRFVLGDGAGCSDTVVVLHQTSALSDSCNNPIAGFGIEPFDPSGGSCLLCINASVVLSGQLDTFVNLPIGIGIAANTPIVGVRDTLNVYPAGRRVGFVVEAVGGLLDLTLLSAFQIQTYLNGTLQESATVGNVLLTADVLPGEGNRTRISFVTTMPFDAVVLATASLVTVNLSEFRIYYAFEEPANSCPAISPESCTDAILVNTPYCADIEDERTGFGGLACVGCSITSIGNLIDNNTTNATLISLPVGVGASASVSVRFEQTLGETYRAGFVVSGGANLLDATVLGGIRLRTYMNGTLVDDELATSGLINVTLLDANSGLGLVSLEPSGSYNEIRLTVTGLVAALTNTSVYYAFVQSDNDLDGTPDCVDKCCLGSDNEDGDGDGSPDACDLNQPPLAVNDNVTTPEDVAVSVPVLNNDNDPEGDPLTISMVTDPPNGTATVVGDSVLYTPDAHFTGIDSFMYVVCDVDDVCDTATVYVDVTPVFVQLQLVVRLQGAMLGTSDTTLMRDELRVKGRIPAVEPYTNIANFTHVNGGGGETIADTAMVFANYEINSVVDWVFVELRSRADSTNVVATRSALLQRDGDVVDVDGVSPLTVQSVSPDSFFVAVRHRNHLGVMTLTAIPLLQTGTVVDFTDLNTPIWDEGANLNGYEQAKLFGKFALWAGNVNTNQSVVYAGQVNDKDPIFNLIDQAPGNLLRSQTYVLNAYSLGDVNLHGAAIFAGQNNDVDFIFNNIDGHPRNILRSQTFIIRQQLPE